MDIWTKAAIMYGVAGCIIGLLVSAMDEVNANFRGHPIPCPRLFAGIVAGIVWPAMVWQMVMPRQK